MPPRLERPEVWVLTADLDSATILTMARSRNPAHVPLLLDVALGDDWSRAKLALDALRHFGSLARDAAPPLASRMVAHMRLGQHGRVRMIAKTLQQIASDDPQVLEALRTVIRTQTPHRWPIIAARQALARILRHRR